MIEYLKRFLRSEENAATTSSAVFIPRTGLMLLFSLTQYTPAKTREFSHATILNIKMEKLNSVQYSAALAITGACRGKSRKKLYHELGWESLNLRRWSRRLVMSYKIVNNITPEYKRHHIPQLQRSMYSLREQRVIWQIKARTERFKNSFYPNCLNEWDKLLPEATQAPSLSAFK